MPIPKADTSQPEIATQAKLGQPEPLPSPRKMPASADAPPGFENPPTADASQDAVPRGHTHPITLDDAIALAFQLQPRFAPFPGTSRASTLTRVTLFCGSGCAGAHDEVVALAEKLKAPVGYAFRGKEWVEYDNPCAVGMSGLLGWGAAYKAMHACDVLLLLGTDFPYDNVHADEPPDRPDRHPRRAPGPAVQAGPGPVRRRPRHDPGPAAARGAEVRSDVPGRHARTAESRRLRKLRTYVDHVGTRRPIHPEYVAATLDELAAQDAVFTMDTGMCAVWGARYLRAGAGRRFLGSFNHGSMANALPQAIGAQAAYPGRQVISLSGDGGLAMLMGDLLTIPQYQLPLKIVLFNNHRLGMVQMEMEVVGLPHYGCRAEEPQLRHTRPGHRPDGPAGRGPRGGPPRAGEGAGVQRAGPGGRGDRPERPRHAAEGDGAAGQGVRPGDDQDGVRGRSSRTCWTRSWPTGGNLNDYAFAYPLS